MRNSAFGFHRFNDGDFDRDDRFHRFHHHHNFNDIIVFDNFGFPVFPPPPFRPFYYLLRPASVWGLLLPIRIRCLSGRL
jgi:hypothetical protein